MTEALLAICLGFAILLPILTLLAILRALAAIGDGSVAVLASIRRDRERRRTYRGLRRDVWTREESKEDEDWYSSDYYGGATDER